MRFYGLRRVGGPVKVEFQVRMRKCGVKGILEMEENE